VASKFEVRIPLQRYSEFSVTVVQLLGYIFDAARSLDPFDLGDFRPDLEFENLLPRGTNRQSSFDGSIDGQLAEIDLRRITDAVHDDSDSEGYENAAPNASPSAEAVPKMMEYNRSLQKAGILLELDGLLPPRPEHAFPLPTTKPQSQMGPSRKPRRSSGAFQASAKSPKRAWKGGH
jgi:hypothetical protein